MVVFRIVCHRLLYLDGYMVNAEFLVGDSLQATLKRLKSLLVFGVNEHVGGKDIVAGGNCPSVNVVNQGHTIPMPDNSPVLSPVKFDGPDAVFSQNWREIVDSRL